MAEPHPVGSPPAADSATRDGRVETLLLDGLEHYFHARYDDAIHVWTRVLFLDRHHASARAYIERARTAVAERQRRADELVDAAADLLVEGRALAARDALAAAAAEGADDERASAVRRRIDRIEQLERVTRRGQAAIPPPVPAPAWQWPRRRSRGRRLAVLAGAVGLVLTAAILFDGWPRPRQAAPPRGPAPTVASWTRLSTSDVALQRARTAFAAGRVAEALVALDRVSAESPARPEADQLRLRLQQMLVVQPATRSVPEVRHP